MIEDESCLPPLEAMEWEWLDVDGSGGYASSSVTNCHTRKYHGLLTANLAHPAGRHVLLSKFEDSLCLGEEEYFFSCHQYPNFLFPPRPPCLTKFSLAPAPQFTYRIDGLIVHKTIMLLPAGDGLLIRYDFEHAPESLLLRLKPFLAFRGFHALTKENPFLDTRTEPLKSGFLIQPYRDMPSLYIRTDINSGFFPSPRWYYNFEYRGEQERGYDCHEDLFLPGMLEAPIKKGRSALIAVSIKRKPLELGKKWTAELQRRSRLESEVEETAGSIPPPDRDLFRQLLQAGRQFLIRSNTGRPAIIAGYHWFDDWGRDTLISLPGLTFCSGLGQWGLEILDSLGRHEKDGLLPNFFSPDEQHNAYNTVDASLWYFWAVQQMLKYTGNMQEVQRSMWPVMKNIIRQFMAGTVYNIHMAENGLLHAGDGSTHLTWMDAMVAGRPVTPRGGFAVEINALWFNALCFAGELARTFGETLFPPDLPERLRTAFQDTFWIADGSYLGDVYADGVLDHAIRPNQVFALSLPFSPLTDFQAGGVLNCLREHLLTPCGLRTLAPSDPAYRGRYRGDSAQRDSAYHQGTVWPWLLGAFGEACLKQAKDKQETRLLLLEHLRDFLRQHLWTAGLGSISEIFDGDPPHRPGGCIAQAWSVGEIIRLYRLLYESND